MMTAQESMQYVGRLAALAVDRLSVRVKVLDCRKVWARTDCLVAPLAGEGEQWVSVDRLRFED